MYAHYGHANLMHSRANLTIMAASMMCGNLAATHSEPESNPPGTCICSDFTSRSDDDDDVRQSRGNAFRALIYPHYGHANVMILLTNLTIVTAGMMRGNLAATHSEP